MFEWEALKQPSQLGDKLLPCLGQAESNLMEYTNEDKGWRVLFALLSVTKPLLYGSQFDFDAVQLPLKSRRQQSTLQRHFAFDWVVESCLFIELNTNTQMRKHSQRHGHTHSGVYAISSWDRQTPPVHHSPRSFQRSVIIPGQKHLGRMTNLHSARCPGWLSLPCRFYFRRDSVIAEASYDWNGDKSHKGETDKDRKSPTVRGNNTNSVYSQLIKTSSEGKSWLQPCVKECVCVCVLSVCLCQ